MTVDPGEVEGRAPMGVAAIVELVRAATEGQEGRAAKLAAQARAARPDVAAALAAFEDGSPDALQALAALRALGVTAAAIKASVGWHRGRERAQARGEDGAENESSKPGRAEGWEGRLVVNAKGEPESVIANAITILRCHPDWKTVLAWDDFQESIIFLRSPPWDEDDRPQSTEQGDEGRYLTDSNTTAVAAWLTRHYGVNLNDEQVYKAARVVARGEGARFNSMLDYFAPLVWDHVDRIGASEGARSWLSTYLGVVDSPYAQFVGRAWLVSAIARAKRPGCQADHVLILEGKPGPTNQGSGKTRALRVLFGDQFSDSAVDMHSKDRFINLRGILCQSFDELASLGRSEADHVKGFLSAQYDIFRPPYARESIKAPRRCIFAGTVNPRNGAGYLRDETGARRFWPVGCGVTGPIDLAALARDRDQIWAQAVYLYGQGVAWHPATPEERALCEAETAERTEGDPWDDKVAKWIQGKSAVTGAQVLSECIGVPARDQGQRELNRVGAILARMGWIASREQVDGDRRRRFHAPPPPTLAGQMLQALTVVARLKRELDLADEAANRLAIRMEAERVQMPSEEDVEHARAKEYLDLVREPGGDEEPSNGLGTWADQT